MTEATAGKEPGASSSVRVAVRIRPVSGKELLSGKSDESVTLHESVANTVVVQCFIDSSNPGGYSGNSSISNNNNAKVFAFDKVFGTDAAQVDVYTGCALPLVHRFVAGYNATVLAYGQTGSGKTHTMGTGLDARDASAETKGIVPRAIEDMFQLLKNKENTTFALSASFLELYNEDLVDLLNPSTISIANGRRPNSAPASNSSSSNSNNPHAPTIREDAQGNIVFYNVREEPVSSPLDLLSLLQRGSLCRATGATDMNATSSRSHAIFTIILRQTITLPLPAIADASSTDTTASPPVAALTSTSNFTSKFHFVDLAGSERLKRTNAAGDRKREGISINQGLLALGNVISALDHSNPTENAGGHVPYRDSKLTRMLQDSLGGNSATLMIACVSPASESYGETVSTLHYANRARNIRNRAVVNRDVGGAGGGAALERECRALRTLVVDLREEVARLRGGGAEGEAGIGMEDVGMGNEPRERGIQLRMQEEREMHGALEAAETETRLARFDADRALFQCTRVLERQAGLEEELRSVQAERDAARVELEQWRCGRRKVCACEGPLLAASGTLASEIGSVGEDALSPEMIASYVATISDLKVRLAETNDRLAWYNEVVSSFGSEEARRDKIVDGFQRMVGTRGNVPSSPSLKGVREVIEGEDLRSNEVAHEGRLWKAIGDGEVDFEEIPSVGEAQLLEGDETVAPQRLFGVPKNASESLTPSRLANDATPNDYDAYESDPDRDGDDEEAHMETLESIPDLSAPGARQAISSAVEDKSRDIYLLISRLQSDIAHHQSLIDKQRAREQEYLALRAAYESKLDVLQGQLRNVGRERDEALQRFKNAAGKGGAGPGERPGTAAIKARFDEQKRKLEAQIAEYRRKMAEGARERGERKNEGLTKQLMQTIEALKGDLRLILRGQDSPLFTAEKVKALKELKKEASRTRDLKTSKEREIARLRRREKAATELAKRLERSNQLQRVILKRRSEEVLASHSRLKSVMTALKKSQVTAPKQNVRFKNSSSNASGIVSPTLRSKVASFRGGASKKVARDDAALLRSLGTFGGAGVRGDGDEPPVAIKAQFKKGMIDKEVETTVSFRIAELELNVMKNARDRLVGEQRELMNERERCIAADAEMTRIWNTAKPQYMDDRLSVIDMEVAMYNARIRNLEDEIRLGKAAAALSTILESGLSGGASPPSPPQGFASSMSQGDLGWDNAVNLTKSLDVMELEFVAVLFLQDLVDCKIHIRGLETKLADSEKTALDLRGSLSTMRGAALQTAVDYRKELDHIRSIAADKIAAALEDVEALKRVKHGSGMSRSKSTLFSFEEFGSATPKLQKMFDSAYGRGFVVIQPSVKNLASGETDVLRESVAKALEGTPIRHLSLSSSPTEEDKESVEQVESSSDEEEGVRRRSPVIRSSPALIKAFVLPPVDIPLPPAIDNECLTPEELVTDQGATLEEPVEELEDGVLATLPEHVSGPRYNLRRRGRKGSSEVAPAAEEEASGGSRRRRGRAETRPPPEFVEPPQRSASVPSSPVDPNSDKFIIKSFINARRNRPVRQPDFNASIAAELQQDTTEFVYPPSIETNSDSNLSQSGIIMDDTGDVLDALNLRKRASKASLDSANNTEGSDVFERLATSHTLASQAKVIHRDHKEGSSSEAAGMAVPSVARKLSFVGGME
ncbi:hypothetical protein BC830DRAFT_1153935 [Chytriomyces sp. MP71]|nr:hypothetical protein BC830DRAFT_1153935 [Chytriomyces sp. MP71]